MAVTGSRVFITGASGFVGGITAAQLVKDGYQVSALSRTEKSDATIKALGATPVRGDLESLDVLTSEAKKADMVLHLATAYVLGKGQYADTMHIDNAAADALAEGLAGSGKPLVVTSGTLSVAADPNGNETHEDSPPLQHESNTRIKAEKHALDLSSKGFRVMAVRLPPYTYGHAESGPKMFMEAFARSKSAPVIDGGKNRITSVHVDDAARLYILAAQKGKAGEIYNASSSTTTTTKEVVGAIAETMGLPVVDLTREEAMKTIGPGFTFFLTAENRASGAKAQKELGWKPTGSSLLEEITSGSYPALAKELMGN